jgi:L-lactate dehydrogenase complex protein LldE
VRDLLHRVPELVVCDPAQMEECCGFGGSFATTFAALSVRMGADKVAALRQAGGGVDAVVSADCSCMLHLQGLAPPGLSFHHVAEILREAIR